MFRTGRFLLVSVAPAVLCDFCDGNGAHFQQVRLSLTAIELGR